MLAKRIETLAPSKTMYFTAKAKEMKSQGIDIIDFSVGEPDFQTPENICLAAKQAIDAGHTKYTPVNGILELRQAIAQKLERENGVTYTPDQICVGTGAKQPLFNAVFAVCGAGDEVIIPTPSWVSYEEMVKLAGGTLVFVECLEKEGFALDIEAIRRAVTERTKAIIINTPNNPTGAVYDRETLEKLGQLAVEKHFYIISDEVYEKLVYDGKQHVCVASLSEEIKEWCILINGFSKSYAMTGWRIGYAAASMEVISAIKGIQSHTTSAGNSITQYAALEACRGSQESIRMMYEEFAKRRKCLIGEISRMPLVSADSAAGTFYVMMNISGVKGKSCRGTCIDSSEKLAELLLSEAHIAVIAGSAFHADNYLRICYAVSMENILEGTGRLARFLEQLED